MQPSLHSAQRSAARLLVLTLLGLILSGLAGLPGATHSAQAQGNVIFVNANATGAETGVDWANAYTSLQTALIAPDNEGKESGWLLRTTHPVL